MMWSYLRVKWLQWRLRHWVPKNLPQPHYGIADNGEEYVAIPDWMILHPDITDEELQDIAMRILEGKGANDQ